MILLIDNYDSFSYNLFQLVGTLDPEIRVVRNDALMPEEVLQMHPSRIILSPGPGRPAEAGICESLVRLLLGKDRETEMPDGKIPLLGVCLGHQAICEALGGRVGYAKELMHGKSSETVLDGSSCLFRGLPEKVTVGRYHSLAAEEDSLPDSLRITARSEDGEVMAVEHIGYPLYGVQFHPESILTPQGIDMLKNFLEG